MTVVLDRVHAEIRERIEELRPLVHEHDRLEQALAALGGLGSTPREPVAFAEAPASAGPRAPGRRRRGASEATRPPAGGSGRRRAPRGANRAALLAAVRERPGASTAELAAASGVKRAVAYALLKTLTERGELVRGELPGGTSGYTLPPEAGSVARSESVSSAAEVTDRDEGRDESGSSTA